MWHVFLNLFFFFLEGLQKLLLNAVFLTLHGTMIYVHEPPEEL